MSHGALINPEAGQSVQRRPINPEAGLSIPRQAYQSRSGPIRSEAGQSETRRAPGWPGREGAVDGRCLPADLGSFFFPEAGLSHILRRLKMWDSPEAGQSCREKYFNLKALMQ